MHGEEGLAAAERITESLFSGSIESLAEGDVLQLRQDGLPASSIDRDTFPESVTQLLVDAGMAGSGKQVKDALGRRAVTVNNLAMGWDDNGDLATCFAPENAIFGRFYMVKLGKKKYHLVRVAK